MAATGILAMTPYEALADYERRSLAHAGSAPEQAAVTGLWRGIGFRIDDRHFVSPISEVNEILSLPPLTAVPGARSWLLGIASVRGNLVPVVDLRDFVGIGRGRPGDGARVLLVRQPGGSVGLLVDEVLGQRSFAEEELQPADSEADAVYGRYVHESVRAGEVVWGRFSMNALVRTPEFQQAAA